ncbi:hypothetical protein NL676_014030 [Syzygium grande]|nr:hypothetical protein NL676_014030 [Syzygium grande]
MEEQKPRAVAIGCLVAASSFCGGGQRGWAPPPLPRPMKWPADARGAGSQLARARLTGPAAPVALPARCLLPGGPYPVMSARVWRSGRGWRLARVAPSRRVVSYRV